MAKCCKKCFNDRLISDYINEKSTEIGDCQYCGTLQTKLVYVDSYFTDTFEPLVELYEESDNEAFELHYLLKRDWNVFSEITNAESLVAEILNKYVSKKYKYKYGDESIIENSWAKFRDEIKHKNRFFHSNDVKIDGLSDWVPFLTNPNYSTQLFRARISENRVKFSQQEMDKPPKEKVSSGRANPVGIPYLYCATDRNTAIAEVRPHKSDFVSIISIEVASNLKIADLRSPRKRLSPFEDYNGQPIQNVFKYILLMQKLGDELSKPILPREAHLEYLPSQYLCELLKNVEFDGILYKSSVGSGDNLVLFDGEHINFGKIELFEIEDLNFTSKKVSLAKNKN